MSGAEKKDVGVVSDLIQALMNTCSIEHHAIMSYNKTKEKKWLELRDISRQIRRRWLDRIVNESKGELWCISKHILTASEAYFEIADRMYNKGKVNDADEAYNDADTLIGLLIVLNELNK